MGLGRASSPYLTEAERRLIADTVEMIPVDFGGGSSKIKAQVVADFIKERNLSTVVEVGVYRGRFLLPQAAFLASRGIGKIFGVDPYTRADATQHDTGMFPASVAEQVADFTVGTDWDGLYHEVLGNLRKINAEDHAELIRKTSIEASRQFARESIDVLHVDANHDKRAVKADLRAWLPKMRPGGVIVMDDASWPSIRPLSLKLEKRFRRMFQFYDPETDDFVLFEVAG